MNMKVQSQCFPQNRGKFLAYKILKEKGVFLVPNFREKGVFPRLENADMSSFIVLSEGAGIRSGRIYISLSDPVSQNASKLFNALPTAYLIMKATEVKRCTSRGHCNLHIITYIIIQRIAILQIQAIIRNGFHLIQFNSLCFPVRGIRN